MIASPSEKLNSQFDAGIQYIYDHCPICEKIGKSLACAKCAALEKRGFLVLHRGNISGCHSKVAETMILPRTLLQHIEEYHQIFAKRKLEKTRWNEQVDRLHHQRKMECEIQQVDKKVKHLKCLLYMRKLLVQNKTSALAEARKAITTSQRKMQKIFLKKKKMKDYITSKQGMIDSTSVKVDCLQSEVQLCCRYHMKMLLKHIFPIEVVKEEDLHSVAVEGSGEAENEEVLWMQEELEEARRLAFVHGRWVKQQAGASDIVLMSVGCEQARAPSDGDYVLYVDWLEANHRQQQTSGAAASDPPLELLPSTETAIAPTATPMRGDAVRIAVALSNAAQMLHVIGKLLGLHLPHRLHYKIFCDYAVSAKTFVTCVKLLNSNVLSLCLREGVDGIKLHPLHTLRNLHILVDKLCRDGVRRVPCIPTVDLLVSMETTLGLADICDADLTHELDNCASLDWQLSFDADWETVGFDDTKLSNIPIQTQGTDASSIGTQSSFFAQPTGLVSSAFAWATKGWWGPSPADS